MLVQFFSIILHPLDLWFPLLKLEQYNSFAEYHMVENCLLANIIKPKIEVRCVRIRTVMADFLQSNWCMITLAFKIEVQLIPLFFLDFAFLAT